MPWEKSSADLVDLFQHLVPEGGNVQHKKMFGCLCAFVNGNLCAGLFEQTIFFRLSPQDRAAFLDQPDAAPFEPVPGRPSKKSVLLTNPFDAGDDVVAGWMKCAIETASQLPAKEKAVSKPKKTAQKKKAPAAKRKRKTS